MLPYGNSKQVRLPVPGPCSRTGTVILLDTALEAFFSGRRDRMRRCGKFRRAYRSARSGRCRKPATRNRPATEMDTEIRASRCAAWLRTDALRPQGLFAL